ncbi:MAG: aspartate aminotransferase family protein [Oscillospiraceae bacterium]|jgi:acetylornithine/N-succinyldiaminopimelate aminotransferase|nr:aspartate aminotransferase family protein [Oscillospiraceae bacterium]
MQQIFETYAAHVLPTYGRFPVAFVRGVGCRLYDAADRAYIDFASGIGVNAVGHAHPVWVEAVARQAATLTHVSNLYYSEPGGRLAARLTALSGLRGVFFANSGAEANEGAIKVARKYSHDRYGPDRSTVVTLSGSFHGRTVTTLAATGQTAFHRHFGPFTAGFRHVPPGDFEALAAQPDDVCAVLLEPVQGEGGVWPLDGGYVRQVAALCRERDWLLLCDEVQTGIGRTGDWFAFQSLGVEPDVVTFAKGIAGGLPFGGFLTGARAADTLGPGDHATTFGGTPLCCAAALATLDILTPVLPGIKAKGAALRQTIAEMGLPRVTGTRGAGLMIGVALASGEAPRDWAERLLRAGLVVLTAGQDALRLLPPLVIGDDDIAAGLSIFHTTLGGVSK